MNAVLRSVKLKEKTQRIAYMTLQKSSLFISSDFNEQKVLHELKHYLPSQAPLKDFIHHNTLHAFQNQKFYEGIHRASEIFGYKTTLSLKDYRKLFEKGDINKTILERIIIEKKRFENVAYWFDKLLKEEYPYEVDSRIGKLKANWKTHYRIDLENRVHPILFRILCNYLDQGIAMWDFPVHSKGFLASLIEMEKGSFVSFFKRPRAKNLLLIENINCAF